MAQTIHRGARNENLQPARMMSSRSGPHLRAAALHGQKLFEFVLDSARRQVEETIPDQREFYLSPEAHEAFLAIFDTPAKPDERLKAMLSGKNLFGIAAGRIAYGYKRSLCDS